MITNYLMLGDLIVEHLQTTLSSIKQVRAAIDLAEVQNEVLVTPSIHVVYIGDQLGQQAGDGSHQEVIQTWAAILAVKNLREDEVHRRQELGELVLQVLQSLHGWEPGVYFTPLYRDNNPSPVVSAGGYVFYPLHFSSKLLTNGVY